jgi:hypothetical protein
MQSASPVPSWGPPSKFPFSQLNPSAMTTTSYISIFTFHFLFSKYLLSYYFQLSCKRLLLLFHYLIVCTVNKLRWAGQPTDRGSILGRGKRYFSPLKLPDQLWSLLGSNRPGREADRIGRSVLMACTRTRYEFFEA